MKSVNMLSLRTVFSVVAESGTGKLATGELGKDGIFRQRLKIGWDYKIGDCDADDRYGYHIC